MRRRSPHVLALILLAGLAVAGCGDGSATTATVTSTQTVTGGASADPGSTTDDGASPAAEITVAGLTPFRSPTGNIGCFIDRRNVRCDIAERDWRPPKAPPSCQLDYGQGIELPAGGPPQFVCAGDTALEAGDPLPYGQSIAAGLLRCESAESGMTCSDSETGRGFTISTASYELF